MTLELIPMLLLSLLLMASDGTDPGVARLLLSGDHRLGSTDETVIVGDATVTVDRDTTLTAPVYIIGGDTRVDGAIRARVTQISGTLSVGSGAEVAQLRLIGGRHTVAPAADIGRRVRVDLPTGAPTAAGSALSLVVTIAVLAIIGVRLARTHGRNLDNVADAVARHPVVTVATGALLTLTALSLFVFMAFTLVLIPVTILGLAAGVVVGALGVIAWGHGVGRRLPLQRPGTATAAGVAAVTVMLHLVGQIPVVGDLIVGFVLLSGVGAVTITYIGYSDFRPAALPD